MTADMENESARVDALAFVKRHKTGVLATAGHDNIPHASVIHYIAGDNFNIFFLTQTNSRKYKALIAHPQVAFVVSSEDVPQTLQIEGMAMDVSLDKELAAKKEELMNVLNSNTFFSAPITKLDPAPSAVVWIEPRWIRWADYAFSGAGNDRVLKEVLLQS